MNVTVYFHTILQRQTPEGLVNQMEIALPPQCTLGGLLETLGIQVDLQETLLVVNGRLAELTQVLAEGDKVHLIPAISGGN